MTRVNAGSVAIMRHPCLMEDEGRHFLIRHETSRAKAEQWIRDQKDEYFKPSDYYILTPEGGGDDR